MGQLSNYLEDALLDHILSTTAFTMPTALYVSLHDDPPGETGANEVVGGSYARQGDTAMDAASGGASANTNVIEFSGMPTVGPSPAGVKFVGLWDAVSGGNFLWGGPLGGAASTFTAADTGDLFTSYGHGRVDDDQVVLQASPGSALPTGVSEDVVYYVISATTDTFQLSATEGGGAIALTSDGEGIAFFVDHKATNSGDTFRIAAGDLDVTLD